MLSPLDGLIRLRDGNRRFVSGAPRQEAFATHQARRLELARTQEPFAVVLGCSDSRVPAEYVFDQGLGDLFVIRVAGNVVAPSQIGSVEFAAAKFGTQLVVVLGHSGCGAIVATLEEIRRPSGSGSPNLADIVDRVRPSVVGLLDAAAHEPEDVVIERAVRANIRASVNQLRRGSAILERLIRKHELLVVGAEYSLETGVVDFFDGVPDDLARIQEADRQRPASPERS